MKEYNLTTVDNPYNPFTHFTEWHLFDVLHGYNSCEYMMRIARTSDEFTEQENIEEVNRACDEIIKLDPFGIYTKIARTETIN